MGRAIALRDDYDGPVLRRLSKASKDTGQVRRLLSLAEIYDGSKRTKAAKVGGVGLQTVRDWVLRFNAKGPEGLIDGKARPAGTPRPCNGISMKSRPRLHQTLMPSSSLSGPDGTRPAN